MMQLAQGIDPLQSTGELITTIGIGFAGIFLTLILAFAYSAWKRKG